MKKQFIKIKVLILLYKKMNKYFTKVATRPGLDSSGPVIVYMNVDRRNSTGPGDVVVVVVRRNNIICQAELSQRRFCLHYDDANIILWYASNSYFK